ncbi:MAG: DoxX family membrane protein [Lutibacter sp.]|nr:DoxX family membrane protein [Lutibacter sp.]MDT8418652.1 DoxX family membrane protein [Lutibacter sp.]
MNQPLNIWSVLKIVFALFIIYAGVQHFLKPDFFVPFVPQFLPLKTEIVYVSGVFEIGFGLLLFFKKYAKIAALGIFVLLLLFLPIHIWDVISETPVIGSKTAAWIRLPIQFLLIFLIWKIKNNSANPLKN